MLFFLSYITLTTLNKVCDDIRYDIENQQITAPALWDISYLFDTVHFDILLAILRSINISPKDVGFEYGFHHIFTAALRVNALI